MGYKIKEVSMKYLRCDEKGLWVVHNGDAYFYTFIKFFTTEQYKAVIKLVPQEDLVKALLLEYPWAIRMREYL